MRFGPVATNKLPEQDPQRVLLMAERFQRASEGQSRWAEQAKTNVDFFEGRQWSEEQLAEMAAAGRPALTFNIIAPLVRLILGYHSSNKSDINFQPGNDALATLDVAEALTAMEKTVANMNKMQFVDTEVFMDGIVTGRGFYRTTLDFGRNDLGECLTRAVDPFNVYLDPEGDTYDLNDSCSYVQHSKWISLDEIEHEFGEKVAENLKPFVNGHTPVAPATGLVNFWDNERPMRGFGDRDDNNGYWDSFYATMDTFTDTHRKTLRILDTEHYRTELRYVAVDLETGDRKILPAHWDGQRVQKIVLFAEQTGNPIVVQRRRVKITWWTTTCGDLMLHNAPSPYSSFSITPYFPYFRRGHTRGAIDDLIDPQREKNKRRSVEIEAVSKLSNGGWAYEEGSLDFIQEQNLRRFGAAPGFILKYKAEKKKPEQIQPAAPPMAHERLESKSDEDIRRISGINESALGEVDKVQSGRAIEARQRQAVISIQLYMDNFKRSKEILGAKRLEIYQEHYTEPRIYRLLGEDGRIATTEINKRMMDPTNPGAVAQIVNNITLGLYTANVDEQPLSKVFANAQFEEMLTLLEKMAPAIGPVLPAFADLIFDASSMPRKTEWIERLQSLGIGQPQPVGGQMVDPMTGQPVMVAPGTNAPPPNPMMAAQPGQPPQQALPAPG